jgi:hypothetical protein
MFALISSPSFGGFELGKRLVRQWCREKLSSMIEPTEQELQMIEIIREQKSNFQLVIGSQDGAWEVALSVPSFKSDAARGGRPKFFRCLG